MVNENVENKFNLCSSLDVDVGWVTFQYFFWERFWSEFKAVQPLWQCPPWLSISIMSVDHNHMCWPAASSSSSEVTLTNGITSQSSSPQTRIRSSSRNIARIRTCSLLPSTSAWKWLFLASIVCLTISPRLSSDLNLDWVFQNFISYHKKFPVSLGRHLPVAAVAKSVIDNNGNIYQHPFTREISTHAVIRVQQKRS